MIIVAQPQTGHEAAYSAYRSCTPQLLLPPPPPPPPPPPSPSDAPVSPYYRQHLSTRAAHPSAFNTVSRVAQLSNAYMNPNLAPPLPQQSYQSSPNHGIKRTAPDDDFERTSHISNEFKKLRLNNNHRPTANVLEQSAVHSYDVVNTQPPQAQTAQDTASPAPYTPERLPSLRSDDFMTVDETPDRVYIPDIESEIAAIEAFERSSSQLFLADFEKQIGAIPDHVLRPGPGSSARDSSGTLSGNDQALVLYQDPSSISVPEEEDVVRKAILDARRGIREKMRRQQQRERESANATILINNTSPVGFVRNISDMGQGEKQDTGGMNNTADFGDAMDLE